MKICNLPPHRCTGATESEEVADKAITITSLVTVALEDHAEMCMLFWCSPFQAISFRHSLLSNFDLNLSQTQFRYFHNFIFFAQIRRIYTIMAPNASADEAIGTSHTLQTPLAHIRKMSEVNADIPALLNEAKEATNAEKSMTIWQAFKTYPKAVIFSIILSTAIVMEGYDVVLLANLYAFPSFNKKYGSPTGDPTNPYQIPAPWQAGLSNGANVGEILGLFINGIVSERYGYRKTMMVSLVAVIGFIFIPFFAQNLVDLQIGEILCGIPWGVFQTLTTAYASEVCPTQLRAYLTTYVNLCWVMGQLIGSGVLRSLVQRSDQWSYCIPFAIQVGFIQNFLPLL